MDLARRIRPAAAAMAIVALAGCVASRPPAPPARHAPPPAPAPTLTSAQQGYVCADLKASHIPGQPDAVYLLPQGRGFYEFDPQHNDAGLSGITATIPQMKAMIGAAISAGCPQFAGAQLSWPAG